MAYTRRRRRARRQSPGMAGGGKLLLALVIAGGVIYLVSASAAGTWIAQNVMAPVFAAVDGLVAAPGTPTPALPGAQQSAQAGGSAPAAQQVEMPAMTCFALQMGVYQSAENAGTQAGELQKQGAGGYIMEDAGRYRVLAAAYADEDSLRQVREQLTAEGMECAGYTLASPQSLLNVTATAEQVAAIQGAFTALHTLQGELTAAALAFDQQQQSPSQGREQAAALLARLQTAKAAFSGVATEGNAVLAALAQCLDEYESALGALSTYPAETFVDFSSKMKYTQLYTANAYASLAQAISAM